MIKEIKKNKNTKEEIREEKAGEEEKKSKSGEGWNKRKERIGERWGESGTKQKKWGLEGLNHWPADLESAALPLS